MSVHSLQNRAACEVTELFNTAAGCEANCSDIKRSVCGNICQKHRTAQWKNAPLLVNVLDLKRKLSKSREIMVNYGNYGINKTYWLCWSYFLLHRLMLGIIPSAINQILNEKIDTTPCM